MMPLSISNVDCGVGELEEDTGLLRDQVDTDANIVTLDQDLFVCWGGRIGDQSRR